MRYLWLAAAAAILTLPAHGAIETQLSHCATISDDSARLACFDALAATTSNSKTVAAATTIAPPTTVISAASAPQPTKAQAVAEFGVQQKPAETVVEDITFKVTNVSKDAYGKLSVTLSNGQVWRQTDSKSYAIKPDQTVTIRKAALGSFLLNVEGRNGEIRVKRAE